LRRFDIEHTFRCRSAGGVDRAPIILACAEGMSNARAAQALEIAVKSVSEWRRQFAFRLFCSEVGDERAELAWHGPNHSPDNIFIHP
jgi:Homeodomain-like domain